MKKQPSWVMSLAVVTMWGALVGLIGCGAQRDPGDSSTHFWQTCSADEQCGDEYQCLCGRCTEACNRASDCGAAQAACVAATGLGECSLAGNVCAAVMATEEHPDAGGDAPVTAGSDLATGSGVESAPTSDGASSSTGETASPAASTAGSTNAESSDAETSAAPAPGPWSPILEVQPAENFSFAPLVTVDSAGSSVVTWISGTAEAGYSVVANTHHPDVGWGEEARLATSPNLLSLHCASSNGDGATIVGWVAESETGLQPWAALFDGETGWSPSTAIGAASAQINSVACARDAVGNATVTWTAHDGTKSVLNAVRFELEGGWGAPERLDQTEAQASSLSLALDGAGNALVLWNAWLSDADELWSNRYVINEGWQPPVRLPSSPGLRVPQLSLALTDAGSGVGVWWEQADEATQTTLFAIPFTSDGTWAEPEVVTSGTDGIAWARAGVTGPQSAVVVWEGFRSTDDVRENRIFVRTKTESGWEEPLLLAEDAVWVSLAASQAGYAVAAWRTPLDYMVDGDVVVAQYDRQRGWGEALVLSEDLPGDALGVYPSVNDNGQACVVWQQADDDLGGHILFTRADGLSSR